MNVPFVDLKAQYASIKPEVAAAIDDVLERTSFHHGPPSRPLRGRVRPVHRERGIAWGSSPERRR